MDFVLYDADKKWYMAINTLDMTYVSLYGLHMMNLVKLYSTHSDHYINANAKIQTQWNTLTEKKTTTKPRNASWDVYIE